MSIIYLHDDYSDEELRSGNLRVMSTFSGIGAASVSWSPIQFEFKAYCEPAAFQCHVLHYRRGASRPKYLPAGKKQSEYDSRKYETLPTTGVSNFGDITQITDDDLRALGDIDVLEGGSPCQAFSLAGHRKGLEDPRGNLLLAFCDLAERMYKINNLRYVVWENVHGVLSDKTNGFGCLLASLAGEYGGPLQPPGGKWTNAGRVSGPEDRKVAWRTIEASSWGLPQRRKRVFVVATLGKAVHAAFPDEILFNLRGSNGSAAKGYPTRQVVVSTFRGDRGIEIRSAEERLKDPDVQAQLKSEQNVRWIFWSDDAMGYKKPPQKVSNEAPASSDPLIHPRVAGTLCANAGGLTRTAGQASELDFVVVTKKPQVLVSPQLSGTLNARQAMPVGLSSEHNFIVVTKEEDNENPAEWTVRRFTPLECERLQGFPDYWTDVPFRGKLPLDSIRYGAIGNSMPCTFMSWLGMQISLMDELEWMMAQSSFLNRSRGRPPKNGVAMTNAERQRLHRQKQKA